MTLTIQTADGRSVLVIPRGMLILDGSAGDGTVVVSYSEDGSWDGERVELARGKPEAVGENGHGLPVIRVGSAIIEQEIEEEQVIGDEFARIYEPAGTNITVTVLS